ncbi:MAG: hypothetical protein WAV08_14855 [Desulfobacterales bacterium]
MNLDVAFGYNLLNGFAFRAGGRFVLGAAGVVDLQTVGVDNGLALPDADLTLELSQAGGGVGHQLARRDEDFLGIHLRPGAIGFIVGPCRN